MKYVTIMLVLALLIVVVGCTNPDVIYINRTIYNDSCIPIIINNTIIETCNITCPVLEDCPSTGFNRDYTLSLIQRVKFLEGRQDLYWNDTECHYDLNRTEFKLEECEEEICDNWNSSWC